MMEFVSVEEMKNRIIQYLSENGPCYDLWLADMVDNEDVIGDTYVEAMNQLLEAHEVGWLKGNRLVLTYGEDPLPANVTTWNYAMDWAREHGAKIRRGKVTKVQARARIYEAGLRKEFNHAWPTYGFSEIEGLQAKEELVSEERRRMYAKRQWIYNRIEEHQNGE